MKSYKHFAYLLLIIVSISGCSTGKDSRADVTAVKEIETTIKQDKNKVPATETTKIEKTSEWYIGGFGVEGNNIFSEKAESVILEKTEPVNEIKSEADVFPLWGQSSILNRQLTVTIKDGDTKIWGKGNNGIIESEIKIKIQLGNKVYVCHGETSKEITYLLNQYGMDISKLNPKSIKNYQDHIIFSLTDGKKEALFLSKADSKEGIKTIVLNKYNIVAAAQSFDGYSYDDLHQIAFIAQNDKRFYVVKWHSDKGKLLRYELPDDITGINDICIVEDVKEVPENPVFIKAYKKDGKGISYFKVNLNKKTITEYLTLKSFEDEFPLKWSFQSDLIENAYVEKINDVVLVSASDGQISGHHQHSYLYGLDACSGKRIWSVYGGYMGVPYSTSKDKKYIYCGISSEGSIVCMETNTGRILWKKVFSNPSDIFSDFTIDCLSNRIILRYDKGIKAYNANNGDFLWEKKLGVKDYLYVYKGVSPLLIVSNSDSNDLTAYEYDSGKVKWKTKGLGQNSFYQMNGNNKLQVTNQDIVKIIDAGTGKVIETKVKEKSGYEVMIPESLSGKDFFSGSGILYSISDKKIKCIDKDGHDIWEMYYNSDIRPYPYRYPYPVRINNKLYVFMNEMMVAIDMASKKVLYQVSDYPAQFGVPKKIDNGICWFAETFDGQLNALRIIKGE